MSELRNIRAAAIKAAADVKAAVAQNPKLTETQRQKIRAASLKVRLAGAPGTRGGTGPRKPSR
jgi:hypothetical protein